VTRASGRDDSGDVEGREAAAALAGVAKTYRAAKDESSLPGSHRDPDAISTADNEDWPTVLNLIHNLDVAQ
jgi:hypothetical protein